MRDMYLGDSYDLIKRVWCQSLTTIAPLYAHPTFVPQQIRSRYSHLTGIPILDSNPGQPFGLLLDPDTGIPLPQELMRKATVSHAPLSFIIHLNELLHPTYIICFDQSYHRRPGLSKQQQRLAKQQFLSGRGLQSFYYVSHAPFLFASAEIEVLDSIHEELASLGIPEWRFER